MLTDYWNLPVDIEACLFVCNTLPNKEKEKKDTDEM